LILRGAGARLSHRPVSFAKRLRRPAPFFSYSHLCMSPSTSFLTSLFDSLRRSAVRRSPVRRSVVRCSPVRRSPVRRCAKKFAEINLLTLCADADIIAASPVRPFAGSPPLAGPTGHGPRYPLGSCSVRPGPRAAPPGSQSAPKGANRPSPVLATIPCLPVLLWWLRRYRGGMGCGRRGMEAGTGVKSRERSAGGRDHTTLCDPSP
jgi:hypothetical protein